MNKPLRGDEPTDPFIQRNMLRKHRIRLVKQEARATGRFFRKFPSVTGKFLRKVPGATGNFFHKVPEVSGNLFRKFHKPIIIGATALTLIGGTVAAVSLTSSEDFTPSGDEIQLQHADQAQIKKQLLASSKNWDVRRLKDALQKGVSIDSQDEFGETPLLIISRTGKIGCMKFLLDKGANPNVQDNTGWSALINVSREGNLKAAKLLFEFGANPKLFNKNRETALFWADNQRAQ